MKTLVALSLIATSLCSTVFANPVEVNTAKVLSVFHVNDRALQEITHGKHPDYVLEFPANTLVPVAFFLQSDLVDLVDNPGNFSQIRVKRTFYTRVQDGKILFSTDLAAWKEFTDFFTGTTSFNLLLEEGLPVLNVGLEAALRAQ